MSSRKGGANPSRADTSDPSFKGKSLSGVSSPDSDRLSQGVSDLSLNSTKVDDGWKVYEKKSKNKTGSSSSKQSGPQQFGTAQNLGMRSGSGRGSGPTRPAPTSDARKPAGRGYSKPQSNYVMTPAAIAPPLEKGWNWSSKHASADQPSQDIPKGNAPADQKDSIDDDDDDAFDDIDDESDDELMNDGSDSDESQKSHETRKKNKWFKELFASLDGLTIDQINEPERQWHCPACKGGRGDIAWYRGLQPLITHARTHKSRRVKLHREFAELLDEELRMRGTSAIPAGEHFGKWHGLEESADREIIWPPMVIIMNTVLDKDDYDRWTGMGSQELVEYFSEYPVLKARHSYGPQGHRGISVLIFEPSAVGYMEAERLNKHFEDTLRDRFAWVTNRRLFHHGGQRKLYGFMAVKQDLDDFNRHSQGKSKLKYEMRSYREMVVNQLKQMSEDNQKLVWYKDKVAKEQKSNKVLEESVGVLADKLRKTTEENRMVKLRTKKHHEQHKEEMDFQEQFFTEQMHQFNDARTAKEENFEKIQQHQREKLTQIYENLSSVEERMRREQEIASSIKLQDKDIAEYRSERDELMKAHEERKLDLQRRYNEEMVDLEKQFAAEFDRLLEKYYPNQSSDTNN